MNSDILTPEQFHNYKQAIFDVGHNINYVFDMAMQGNFEDLGEVIEDLWLTIIHLRITPDYLKHIAGINVNFIKEKLCGFDEKFKLELYSGGEPIEFYMSFEEKKQQGKLLDPNEINWYNDIKDDVETIRRKSKELGFMDCLSYCEHCFNVDMFGKDLLCYLENYAIPMRIASDLLAIKPEFFNQQKEDFANDINNLFAEIDDKIKAGWLYLMDKEVIVYNAETRLLELSKKFEKKYVNRGNGTYYAFIGAFLSGQINKIDLEEEPMKTRVYFACYINTNIFLNQLEKLCGIKARSKAYDFIRNSKNQNENGLFKAPEKAFDLYKLLNEFERNYKRNGNEN